MKPLVCLLAFVMMMFACRHQHQLMRTGSKVVLAYPTSVDTTFNLDCQQQDSLSTYQEHAFGNFSSKGSALLQIQEDDQMAGDRPNYLKE